MSGPQAYLLKVTSLSLAGVESVGGPLFPGGLVGHEDPFSEGWYGVASTEYLAATIGRTAAPGDLGANTWVRPALATNWNFANALNGGVSQDQGGSQWGVLTINDVTGDLDRIVKRQWDGATLELLRGPATARFDTWSTVAKMSAAGIVWDMNAKQIQVRPYAWKLESPLHDLRYTGSGGTDGDTTIANRLKPWLLGQCFNVTPVLINATNNVWQFTLGSAQAVTAVREGGSALSLDTSVGTGGNVTTYAALVAATIASGKYATCLALGLIRLGSVPLKGITIDAQGDADTIGGTAGYVYKRAAIARRVVLAYGESKLSTADLDEASFTAMDAAQAATIGIYFDGGSEVTKAAALNAILAGVAGHWRFTMTGQLKVGYISLPGDTADFSLTRPKRGQDKGDANIVGGMSVRRFTPPLQMIVLKWGRNYTVQRTEDLAGIALSSVQIYGADARQVSASSDQFRRSVPTAPIRIVDSLFATEADAQAEANRQIRIFGQPRAEYDVPTRLDPFTLDPLGLSAEVVGETRYEFNSSRILLCTRMSVSGQNTNVLTLWG